MTISKDSIIFLNMTPKDAHNVLVDNRLNKRLEVL